MQTVVLVEYPIYDQYPIASGYIHAFARTSDVVRHAYRFVYHQETIARVTYEQALDQLRKLAADIYCFSAYVWNMGLIRRLVSDLERDPHVKRIIIGGHQASNQLRKYIRPHQHKVVIINGPGEVPFRDVLIALLEGRTLSSVSGISCFVDGEPYEGGLGEQLPSPEDIPSPFLEGLFGEARYPMTVFETNRGCPYRCSFCTWGGPTVKVTKFPLERVKAELEWIAKRLVFFIYIGDANWGMLPRDVELSEYIGELKARFGTPWGVYFAAAKNKPKGSVACIKAFHRAGVITSQALGIQSTNDATLAAIDRKNIKTSAFLQMFDELSDAAISSFCELIWPLPRETLESFKSSFQSLSRVGARTIIAYPTMLINNASLTADAEKYGLSVVAAADWKSEIKIVTSTATASREDVLQGYWFYYAFFLLGNCDGHKALFRFARAELGLSETDLVTRFSHYLQSIGAKSEYFRFLQRIFDDEAHGDLRTIGALACHLTYEHRAATQRLVAEFLLGEFETDPWLRVAFTGLWLAAMPRVFKDTKAVTNEVLSGLSFAYSPSFCQVASLEEGTDTTVSVLSNPSKFETALGFFGLQNSLGGSVIRISDTFGGRMPYGKETDRNHVYAHGMIQRLTDITPSLSVR